MLQLYPATTPFSQRVRHSIKPTVLLLAAAIVSLASVPAGSATEEGLVFRDPFVLRLRVDGERYYEERFGRTPYVAEGDVYLFAGESFGITVDLVRGEITRIRYQPDIKKADVEFKFTQEISTNAPTMLLLTKNKLGQTLFFDALMTVPEKKEIYGTTVLPVRPHLTNTESWPHPIVQLVLRNFRLSSKKP